MSLILFACAGEGDLPARETTAVPGPTLSSIQAKLFTPQCVTGCHAPGGIGFGETGLDLSSKETSFENLVNHESTQAPSVKRVELFMPGASYLVQKLEGTAQPEDGRCCATQMPLSAAPLPFEAIQAVKGWIEAGALND